MSNWTIGLFFTPFILLLGFLLFMMYDALPHNSKITELEVNNGFVSFEYNEDKLKKINIHKVRQITTSDKSYSYYQYQQGNYNLYLNESDMETFEKQYDGDLAIAN